MGLIRYQCPATRSQVETAIETRKDVLVRMGTMDLTIWVWCPRCMAGHQIKPADAKLADDMFTIPSPSLQVR
jgi:hypothetical protein